MNIEQSLKFLKLSPEEMKERHILGRLYGSCADLIKSTRNGRKYSEQLWENVFKDPTVNELFNMGGIFGCLGHPGEGLSEVELNEKIAICMPEKPQKGPEGKLVGYWDILDTPCGKIAYTLAKYGFKLGISSRGNGDVIESYTGEEEVDPETYEFQAFDLVTLPAVKEARLNLITESKDKKQKAFQKELRESINNSNDIDRKVMIETLENLGIEYKESSENEEDTTVVKNELEVADNDGMDLVNSLQEALRENNELHTQVFELNEKLSVGNTKEMKLEGKISQLNKTIRKMSESIKNANAVKAQSISMKEQLEKLTVEVHRQKSLTEAYKNKLQTIKSKNQVLSESIKHSDTLLSELNEELEKVKKDLITTQRKDNHLIESLQNELAQLKADSQVKHSQYSGKLSESKETITKYKNIAKQAVDKYIECKATTLGISVSDIKSRLKESTSFTDIDNICESLRKYNLNISKLPFNVGNKTVKKVQMTENLNSKTTNPDDLIDDSILEYLI